MERGASRRTACMGVFEAPRPPQPLTLLALLPGTSTVMLGPGRELAPPARAIGDSCVCGERESTRLVAGAHWAEGRVPWEELQPCRRAPQG